MKLWVKRLAGLFLVGTVALVLTLSIGWWRVDGPGREVQEGTRPLPLTAMDFTLTDHEGQLVDPDTLIGAPSLVFFGFTYCPDICPTTLSDISGWLDDLGSEAEMLNTILITVDPARDTVEAMADYVSYFHPKIRGWTGTPAQIAAAAKGFRVTYENIPIEGGDYTLNHTAGIFLFRADGSFVSTIDYHESREFALPKIRRAMSYPSVGVT